VTTVILVQLESPLGELFWLHIASVDDVVVLGEDVDRQRTVVRTLYAYFICLRSHAEHGTLFLPL
jgi:hypothetical protein